MLQYAYTNSQMPLMVLWVNDDIKIHEGPCNYLQGLYTVYIVSHNNGEMEWPT